ncbi:MAG: DUF721 domain-containing protein [Magnetococcales bacterium]|nr:DUF721 domain-containing protein [Magnetococcales bacterium]
MADNEQKPRRYPRRPKRKAMDAPMAVQELVQSVTNRILDRPNRPAHRLWQAWNQTVGARLAHHTEPTRLQDGVIHVRVDSAVWATQLNFLKPQLIQKFNQGPAKENPITDIRFRQGSLRRGNLPKPVIKTKQPPLPSATPEEQHTTEELVKIVEDTELKQALYRLILKSMIKNRS